MAGILFCAVAMVACFAAGYRSLVKGLCALMTVGYAYGIIRANLPQPAMHFVFDAGVAGLYIALFTRGATSAQWSRIKVVQPWLTLLIGWPVVLFFLPVQEPLVQLVGLRGQIYFLGFVLIGAMLEPEDCYSLARWFAVLNLMAFGFAIAEYFKGVPAFYPRNANTAIIYSSNDVLRSGAFYRIPAVFVNSAAYSGMMVGAVPLLLGAWSQRRAGWGHFYLLTAALVATGLGVFMGASRTWAVILVLTLGGAFIMGHLSVKVIIRSVIAIACVGWIVAHNPRLQRFTTLNNANYVEERIHGSVNESFFNALTDYPMGNGLGGGGTSMPFFLQGRVHNPIEIENEYGQILLEQGIPGLLIWIGFLLWVFTSPLPRRDAGWMLTLKLLRLFLPISFLSASIGTGFLTAIPQTSLMLMFVGLYTTARIAQRNFETARPRGGPSDRCKLIGSWTGRVGESASVS
ncbi:MAG TPA: hypothetical protein VNF29_07605 [Candidatus Binataceae bacterium]|nr:hypothetical protein [Candidatus Binataceae bacterium]HVC43440.1 hypothetical protein [Candidatus Binataceae bacterium]